MTESQYKNRDENSWAERVRQGGEKATPVTHNGKSAVPPPKNAEEHQSDVHQPIHSEHYANDAQDPMILEEPIVSPADEVTSHPNTVHTANNITHATLDEGNYVPPNAQGACTTLPKWSDLLTTDSENELDLDKQGKKRDKSITPKDDEQRGNENDVSTSAAGPSQPTKTPSPKRPKKLKVESDASTSCERTRNVSRLKKPFL
jgi:hypothetical protein